MAWIPHITYKLFDRDNFLTIFLDLFRQPQTLPQTLHCCQISFRRGGQGSYINRSKWDRGVYQFSVRFLMFLKRDFWLRRTRFLISFRDFQRFIRCKIYPLSVIVVYTVLSLRHHGCLIYRKDFSVRHLIFA